MGTLRRSVRPRRVVTTVVAAATAAATLVAATAGSLLGARPMRYGRALTHAGHVHAHGAAAAAVKQLDSSVVGVLPGELPPPGEADDGAHAVPGDGYTVIDTDGDGTATVPLDGTQSHTHHGGPGSDVGFGGLVAATWSTGANDEIIGTDVKVSHVFPLGKHTVKLTVKDWAGDIHAATTTVTVTDGSKAGVWCYYYRGATALPPPGRPSHASGAATVNFASGGNWPGAPPFGNGESWVARCVGSFSLAAAGSVTFGMSARGPERLAIDGNAVALANSAATVTLGAGGHSVEVLYLRAAGVEPRLVLTTTPSVGAYSHNAGAVLPVITGLSVTGGGVGGGNTLRITGSGFLPGEKVSIGGAAAKILPDIGGQASDDAIVVEVPPAANGPGPATVTVTTVNGPSNGVTYTYADSSTSTPQDVVWAEASLKKPGGGDYKLGGGTSIALGPDRRVYVGTTGGKVHRLDVDFLSLTVTGACSKQLVGQILGVAFNPRYTNYGTPTVFVSIGDLKAGKWTAGSVLTMPSQGGGGCFGPVTKLVTGLPVQPLRDHSVGRPAFDQAGDMLLPVGGTTNAGVPHPKTGNTPESPLSGAIVKVPIGTKGGSFNGAITYSSNNPATAKQTGGDVSVWAAGFRNALFLVRHSSGSYWILDNGSNAGFGDVSAGCDKTIGYGGNANSRDQMHKVFAGGYYGHPNRNRGRAGGGAARECTYRKPGASAPGYTPPVALLDSSTNGYVLSAEWVSVLVAACRWTVLCVRRGMWCAVQRGRRRY